MASFTGTQSKCKACAKTVYPMEQLTANGIIFHRACFRCAHCKATISLNSFAAIEGVPYCKPHFEQLFKQTGSYTRSFEGAIKAEKDATPPPESLTPSAVVKATEKRSTPSPLALKFGGTQDKCKVCSKTVYPLEKISVEGVTYHKQCFRCVHSNCSLTTSNYAALNGSLYCKHHYNQLFLVKGTYSNINKSAAVAAALGVPAEEGAAAPADGSGGGGGGAASGTAAAAAAAGDGSTAGKDEKPAVAAAAVVAATAAAAPAPAPAAKAPPPAAAAANDSDSDDTDTDTDSDDDDDDSD
ncbi:unnamed protein product [Closterium sp. NIES-64]|nr:unnamed protein product [Closterium sp. NIES-64]